MTKCSIFIGVLSQGGFIASQLSIAGVSLGIDADAGAVVRRADEFDAGGFVEAFNF